MRANARLASRAKLTPTDAGRDRALPTGLPRRSWLAVAPALVLALLVLAVAPAAFANDVATAQKVVKDVFGGGNMYRVTERRTLPFRELINTGAESGATFRFVDETVLSVGENAELRLDEFVFDPSTKGIRGAASMTRGALRFVGSAAAKDVSIRTPAGTLGIRGTAFTLRVDGSLLELDVQEGQVSLVAGGAATVVRQGEFVSVRAGVAGVQRGQPGPAFRAAIAQIVRSLGAAPQRAAAPGAVRARYGTRPAGPSASSWCRRMAASMRRTRSVASSPSTTLRSARRSAPMAGASATATGSSRSCAARAEARLAPRRSVRRGPFSGATERRAR